MFISNSQAETQGLSIIEALSSSIPAICPNIPIYQELIRSNENGFLYDDYVELINIIRKCYRNQETLSLMGKNARDKATQFSLPLESLFKNLVIFPAYLASITNGVLLMLN